MAQIDGDQAVSRLAALFLVLTERKRSFDDATHIVASSLGLRRTDTNDAKWSAPMAMNMPELSISPEKAFYILMKAREFEEKTEPSGMEDGSNPADDKSVAVLEDNPEDATEEELTAALDGLNEDEQLDLVALTWIGRGDFSIGDWIAAREEAKSVTHKHISNYLIGTPLFSEYLEEGLGLAGVDLDEFERRRL